ncbi:hypothetical protein [Dactylosporangium darangshiense]|uniref:Uncharacterized protein n=1 Tax=Dactylosporangium darangshiense TaxID=579108 RepID=A0ABP8DRU9_9ACTN
MSRPTGMRRRLIPPIAAALSAAAIAWLLFDGCATIAAYVPRTLSARLSGSAVVPADALTAAWHTLLLRLLAATALLVISAAAAAATLRRP